MNNIFDVEKAKAAILLIISKCGKTSYHTLFKVLYFAEKEHLAKYGDLIIGDEYIAMKNGPVPSQIFDLFKSIEGVRTKLPEYQMFYPAFNVERTGNIPWVLSDVLPEMDNLSLSEIESIEDSIKVNAKLDFNTLTEKSHDFAWQNANQNDAIDILSMAKSNGANETMLKYITANIENSQVKFR